MSSTWPWFRWEVGPDILCKLYQALNFVAMCESKSIIEFLNRAREQQKNRQQVRMSEPYSLLTR